MIEKIQEVTREQRLALATQLGVAADDIQTLDPQWLKFMDEGVLLTVHVSRWRATQKLTLADLGITSTDKALEREAAKQIKLGYRLNMPSAWSKRYQSAETRVRNVPKKYGSIHTHYGDFLTAQSFADAIEELDSIQSQVYTWADDMCSEAGWEQFQNDLYDESLAAGTQAFRTMKVQPDMTEAEFAANYAQAKIDALPPREEVRDSFSVTWELTYVPLPSLIEGEKAAIAASQAEQAAARLELDTEYERAAHAKRMQNLAEREKQDQIWAAREVAEAEVFAKRKMHERVFNEAREKQSAIVDEFMVNYVTRLHSIFNEATSSMLKTTQKNQYFHPRSVLQLENMIKLAEQVRGAGGQMPDIDLMVQSMQASLVDIRSQTRDKEAVAKITRNLEAVEVLSKSALMELGQYTRSGKAATAELLPSNAQRKRARKHLSGEIDSDQLTMPVSRRKPRAAQLEPAVNMVGV